MTKKFTLEEMAQLEALIGDSFADWRLSVVDQPHTSKAASFSETNPLQAVTVNHPAMGAVGHDPHCAEQRARSGIFLESPFGLDLEAFSDYFTRRG